MIKKNVFYKKEIDLTKYVHNISAVTQSMRALENQSNDKSHITSYLDPNLNQTEIDVNTRLFHGGVGVATESVEIIEALRDVIIGMDVDVVNIGEENGDIGWYQAIIMDELGMDWDNVLDTVIAKLRKRFPEKFTNEAAINRDTDTERDLLESSLTSNETK
jgi:NTP pyrophosphatase (non-canonical NTP hydrolase)